MARAVSDSDSVRRQNRGLVLSTLRRQGDQSRTALAGLTGLSHASMTAIMSDLLAQGLVEERVAERPDSRGRGRPPTQVGFSRSAAYAVLFEIDVNHARMSLVDYAGILVDRLDHDLTPASFAAQAPADYIEERLHLLMQRNKAAAGRIRRMAISVQGILDKTGTGLTWSPVPSLAGSAFGTALSERTGIPVAIYKRARLLAEGVRWLDPALHEASVATVFVGSTVAMGLTSDGRMMARGDGGATEFGHMNHIAGGALCRCGMRGCIEAYAADYGVLRTAYSVPETATPAPSVPAQQYQALIQRAEAGDRAASHAFNLAGRAIGYGIGRMLAVLDPAHVLIVGPGAAALPHMRNEIVAALQSTLVCKINGLPRIAAHADEREPIYRGLLLKALQALDSDFE
ncbi:MAG: ROK family transcriptional regulator [Devosia sp.]|uniref:ROK family transcriptional regulator n=1 Tax=Devosia sp. TaxID=1871048 RepID=UPI0024C7EC44|nr:ROK family transcriptional regulator [Devosia sp.]UYO00544.1 MAG: ROK family transcriptional regulator [Devosia sp.]